MNDNYTTAHTENATDLYELRQSWLDGTGIQASAFEGVEERLSANIHHCSRALRMEKPINDQQESAAAPPQKSPTREPDCFVFLASHINAPQPETSRAGYNLACQWLMQDPAKAAAAEAALSFYPEADPTPLHKLYDEHEALRPTLFRLYRKQMQPLPIAKVNTAATAESSTAALKIEALHYAAANAGIGMDIFRTHYLPLLSGKTQFDADIVEAAIWGGMVRNDPDATRAISAALTNFTSATGRAKLLRLAALSGSAEYLPLLLQAADNDPDTGYPLLVLYGQKSVMPELLKALENARSMERAAAAYTQLTDQILPRIPSPTEAGAEAEEGGDENDEDAPQIPDTKAARAWWNKHQTQWKAEERWLCGKPATPAHLIAMCKKYAGNFGCDLTALLALAQKKPLNIPPEIWRARQQQLLAASAQTTAKPDAQTTAKQPGARRA